MTERGERLVSDMARKAAWQTGGLVLACALALPVWSQPMGLPSMGSAASAQLSPQVESALGDAIMEQGRRDPTYISDPEVSQYLTELGRQLAAASPGSGQTINVFAIRDPQINAFALPGGYVGIHSGLVTAADNESQLAAVVAHEIGHVLQRHVARGMTQQSQTSHLMLASVAAALLAALAGGGDLAMGVAAFGQAAALDRQLGFSRQAEQEADRVGLEMLRRSGYDPRGMVQMFGQLMNASRLNQGTGGGAYASTHPLSVQRMSDIENRVHEVSAQPREDSDTFWYVRAKLRVLQARSNQLLQSALSALRRETQEQTGVRRSAAWYGLAYAAWQKKDVKQARLDLQKAQENGRNSPEIAALSVLLELKQGDGSQALTLADNASKRWPDSLGVALARVSAMHSAGQDLQAVQFLSGCIKKWPEEAVLYQLQGQSYERLGQPVEARRAMAVYYEKTGALPTAVEQLQQAREITDDFYVQSQLDVHIRTIKDRLASSRELLERFR